MTGRKEKIIPFEVSQRKEYVKDRFSLLFVPGILACILRGILSFPLGAIREGVGNFYLRTFLVTVLEGLDTAIPVLFLALATKVALPALFRCKSETGISGKLPLAFLFGIPGTVFLSLFGLGMGLSLVEKMESEGFIVSFTLPDGGTTLPEKLFFILLSALLPALFCEPLYRGVMMSLSEADSYPLAVLVPALLFAANHPTLQQMLYLFLSGLLLGWLYLRTGSLWLVLAGHAVSNGVIAALWSFGKLSVLSEQWVLFLTGGAALVMLGLLLIFFGFAKKHPVGDRPFTPAECLKALFLTIWIYILLFAVLFQIGEWHLEKPDYEVPGMEDFDDTPTAEDIAPWNR